MPPKKLILDGLWYCLCPSFNLVASGRPGLSLIKGKQSLHTAGLPAPALLPRRCHSSRTSAGANNEQSTATGYAPTTDSSVKQRYSSRTIVNQGFHNRHGQPKADVAHPPKIPPALKKLAGLPTVNLEAKLQELSAKAPKIKGVMRILRILVKDRQVRPGVRHYRALILANTDAKRGSPKVLRDLLCEMEEHGIPADSGTLHAALQVLAVHPDYLLRQEILQTLRDRWLPLSPAGWHYVVAGLLRENQFELALDHAEQMARKDIMIEDWLHSLLVYNLCDLGEFDEVRRLMRSRAGQGHNISLRLWQHVLDGANAAVHHETTCYVWTQVVQLGYLAPSRTVCSNVLAVASHAGDTDLAELVVRYLADNEIRLESQDYGNLAGTHAKAGNLAAAFEVLCSRHKAGFQLEDSSTQPILTSLIQTKICPKAAWDLLKQLKAKKHNIPLGCANVVFQLCENDALNDPFVVDDAVDLYKDLYSLCPEGADVSMFNTLIRMSRRAKNSNVAMFFVKEMASLEVIPDRTTFERLILMCLDAGNYRSAYLYLHDMRQREFAPCPEAQAEIRDLCAGVNDKFAVRLRYHRKIRGDLLRAKGPVDALVPKNLIKNPTKRPLHPLITSEEPRPGWMGRMMSQEDRRKTRTWRRKFKRRRAAIEKAQEEDGWADYQPGGLDPEVRINYD